MLPADGRNLDAVRGPLERGPSSREEFEGVDVRRAHGGEVAAIKRRDARGPEALSYGDEAGVGAAEWEVGIALARSLMRW